MSEARNRRRLAHALLQVLLPKARAIAARMPAEERAQIVESMSPIACAQMAHADITNMAGAEVVRGEAGGWLAHINFDVVPPGVANVYGTHSQHPFHTAQQAVDSLPYMLAMVLVMHEAVAGKPQPRVLSYHGMFFEVPEAVAQPMERASRANPGLLYPSEEFARARIDEATREVFGDQRPTEALMEALPRPTYLKLLAVLFCATFNGVFRHPDIVAAAPGTVPYPDIQDGEHPL